MPQSLLRVGFVGCGYHATLNILPSLRFAPIELVAVCDLNRERAEQAARWFCAKEIVPTADELVRHKDIDAVFVVGPPSLHTSVAISAMRAGKHVFMEKPSGDNLEQARQIQQTARETGQACMVGFMKRFADTYSRAKALMSDPAFGRPTHIFARYGHWNLNCLHDHLAYMSVHLIDLVRFFMGDYARLTAEVNVRNGQYSFALSARFRSGAVGNLVSTAQQPRVQERVEITGERQLIVVDNLVNLEVHSPSCNGLDRKFELSDIQTYRPDFSIPNLNQNNLWFQGYVGEVIHFAESVLAGRSPIPNADDGVAVMRIVDWLEHDPTNPLELTQVEESS
ncbi:MAG TPA: Gfo/Idh/MocA family oxidoreductase [bacterium]|nr:Gfo/Idh/MocA family oxidoreductase [bacterium]HQO35673.1 Gfo/Idh/MocA family oxidoreductase [bacterium]HQP98359.1 Gfo/Idh/MocA family oxidoreductase [bacterium]